MTASPPLLLRTLLVVGLAGLALYPLVGDVFYLQLLAKIMIFAVFAMSLDLLVGFTGLISLGHAAFFGLGAYALMLLTPEYAAASLWLSLAVAVGAAALAGIVIGALVIRTSGVYFIMVTLAFAQMLYYFAIKSKALGGSDGAYVYVKPEASILGWRPFDLGNRVHFYYVALAVMLASYMLLATVLRSLFGRVIQGIRANEPRMRALGYPVFRYKLAAFALAAALAGLAGYLEAAQYGYVNPEFFGWRESGSVLMMVILGGIGTLYGPILGAFVLTLLQDFLSDEAIFHGFHKHWLLPMGIFIVAAVLLLPRGIGGLALGRARREPEVADD